MGIRNWKERWDPDKEFVFNKRLKKGVDKWFMPGDPVDKLELGIQRLRRWWDAGMISLAKEQDDTPKAHVRRITSKCYEVRVPGKEVIRCTDKKEAFHTLALITGEKSEQDRVYPYIEKLNKLMWAVHRKGAKQPEKVKGLDKAIQKLHEAASD